MMANVKTMMIIFAWISVNSDLIYSSKNMHIRLELEKQLGNGQDVYKFCFPDMSLGNLWNIVAVFFSYLSC